MHETMLCISSAEGLRQTRSPDDSLPLRQPCSIACPELYINFTKSCTSFANSADISAHNHIEKVKVLPWPTRAHRAGVSQAIPVYTAIAHKEVMWLAPWPAAFDSLLCRYPSQLGRLQWQQLTKVQRTTKETYTLEVDRIRKFHFRPKPNVVSLKRTTQRKS